MCGLVFCSDSQSYGPTIDALRTLIHRGPDGAGIHRDPRSRATLGHRRLAIIDPAGGAQPLVDESGEKALVVNGMIYNHRDLRRSLGRTKRAEFLTQSDSEVILHGYLKDGSSVAAHLDGMFAYVISDGETVTAARDPIGIKPLYVGRSSSGFFFASEIKALLGLADDIEEFPPGHVFDSNEGFAPYYEIPRGGPEIDDPEEAARLLRETLVSAVRKRLQSDVPLGAFLSGGLDSSIISALAIRETGALRTFSVGLEGSPDVEAARHVARHIGSTHTELALTESDITEALPRVLYHLESFDRDLVRSAVPCWFVSQLASEHVKVVLTGEGADELFAGYTYYKDYGPTDALHEELRRSIASMHNINLQRVDRMTMAHGLEARVPFLDTAMIAFAARIAPSLKLRMTGDALIEKWILRKAFEGLLPDDILWRDKEQFDQGSGTADLLQTLELPIRATPVPHQRGNGNGQATSGNGKANGSNGKGEGRSAEERAYRDMLAGAFDEPAPVLNLVAHWSMDRTSARVH